MTLPLFFFYVFSVITVASALMVIAARNPVHSVLFLILAFVNSAGLFMLAGAEFLALILIVVYVGAVAVLFLFVTMMLDVDFASLRQGMLQYAPVGVVVGVILLLELLLVAGSFVLPVDGGAVAAVPMDAAIDNTRAIGQLLYTRYVFLFQGAAGVLLVAMIGAIVLTLRHKSNVKRQDVFRQTGRKRSEGTELVKVKSGQGL
ncbi:NADH:ubiquinone oxidoreductase subunit J [Devosia sp. Root413D1]|uniref:NADH-quinone oxidoreductase subunit J n=1 Tax=unclassified Devosia TaxID=196773 RepID=UPI0006F7C093|nr:MULTISPECIES: NADH-quinone oxidoreductase subunit J [unclassified Devosia]KQU96402.1 NADH:ubiquinone oxidoreductase subunit J [Devosia sp. Root105]KQW81684.1 NADH:ubiquinone oxidoreductase subunit J [Devosia sp. Root413D1]